MTKRVQKPGADLVDILTCTVCGKEYERKLLRNYQMPRKFCSEACRARAWREAGNKPCKPPVKPAPKPVVETKPQSDSVYRRVHEKACQFAGLTKRESDYDDTET
jgi:hypothetical protein